jgi:hypothetical protein
MLLYWDAASDGGYRKRITAGLILRSFFTGQVLLPDPHRPLWRRDLSRYDGLF